MSKERTKHKIGIIGGGAAGLLAAVLLARAGFAVTILEKNDKIGKKTADYRQRSLQFVEPAGGGRSLFQPFRQFGRRYFAAFSGGKNLGGF